MAAAQPSHRASLLAGLRTGGVRSVSVPHTAGPQASFVISQPNLAHYPPPSEDDELDSLANMMTHGARISSFHHPPRTAACDMTTASFPYQQQWHGMQTHTTPQMAPQPQYVPMYANQQDVQLQMMQMELMRLQALSQLQQYTQYRHDSLQSADQVPLSANGQLLFPKSASPEFRSQNGSQAVPMTAAIGGKFARRASPGVGFEDEMSSGPRRLPSQNMGYSNAISKPDGSQNLPPSKSDTAASWRSNSNDPAVVRDTLAGQRRSPLLRKARPGPLELGVTSGIVPDLTLNMEAIESSNESSVSSKSDGEQVSSTPTTPISGNSNGSLTAAREEASKKLFQGLGLGRPSIHITAPSETVLPAQAGRIVSQPIRQPRGPPASADELGTKNFANRIRKKAIGGLEALMEARERREGNPAYTAL